MKERLGWRCLDSKYCLLPLLSSDCRWPRGEVSWTLSVGARLNSPSACETRPSVTKHCDSRTFRARGVAAGVAVKGPVYGASCSATKALPKPRR